MNLNDVRECEHCGRLIHKYDNIYQVMVYGKRGNQEFLKVCSESCALRCREMSFNIHIKMADLVKRQVIQKLR